ncbi:hypothetical protein Scep_027179 [Stephania cephalantha]|uniref:Uncharacterized protein n=1 Tax=Stephania cephalantha TaxID=152367 RepID=A0AAP0ELI9_9MAGN
MGGIIRMWLARDPLDRLDEDPRSRGRSECSLMGSVKEAEGGSGSGFNGKLTWLRTANGEIVVSPMDPQVFVRLSIGSLGLRIPVVTSNPVREGVRISTSPCACEIRLRGFPVETAPVPFISSPEDSPDPHHIVTSFYLEESDVKSMLAPGCFHPSRASLEISVFIGKQGFHCGVGGKKKQQVGTFRLEVGPEWSGGKPVLLHHGWVGIGKTKPGAELHLRVMLDPDPRYVFQFEDETKSSPQIVQLQGTMKQPIFSCKFTSERRMSSHQLDPMTNYWSSINEGIDQESERKARKGWKVMIHDLSGAAVAAAFIATPFVPSSGCDRVARSNPGAWLIVRPDICGTDSWQPWGKLEAWRERGVKDSVSFRFHLVPQGQEAGGSLLVSEMLISAYKGGEFFIDTDRQTPSGTPVPSPHKQRRLCRVQGEGKSSKPVVQLAMRHVTCEQDAAIFLALAAAVDLSIQACRPFRTKAKRGRGR